MDNTNDPSPTSLLIVAADPLARAGLATLLADRPGLTIIGQLAADADLLANLDVFQPDIVLWDLGWEADELPPDLGELPRPVLALLPNDELAGDSWAAGVQGLLLRSATGSQIQAALNAILHGLRLLDPSLAATLQTAGPLQTAVLSEPLTPREQEVLQLLAEGLTNRAIAQKLDVSEHTVKFHVTAIMSKLDAQSRTEAVVRATRLGLLLL